MQERIVDLADKDKVIKELHEFNNQLAEENKELSYKYNRLNDTIEMCEEKLSNVIVLFDDFMNDYMCKYDGDKAYTREEETVLGICWNYKHYQTYCEIILDVLCAVREMCVVS